MYYHYDAFYFHFAAWDDGTIRAFSPEKAELLYTIHNAHSKVNHGISTLIHVLYCNTTCTV